MQFQRLIRVAILDERPIVRAGMFACLLPEQDMEIIADAASLHAFISAEGRREPDVIVLGQLSHPEIPEAIKVAQDIWPKVQVVVLAVAGGNVRARRAISAGASGFVLQTSGTDEFAMAVRAAHAGRRYFDCVTALEFVEDGTQHLRAKEVEVLRRVAAGKGNKQIAEELTTTEGTVKNYIFRILEKLDAQDRTHAVVIAAERGYLSL